MPIRARNYRSYLKRPIHVFLRSVAERFLEKKDLLSYSRNIASYIPHPIHTKRQELFLRCVEQELRQVHGDSFDMNSFDFGNLATCSIVDHHDILNHPLFISPNIIGNLHRFFEPAKKPKAIVSITDSGLTVSNFGNRRGLKFSRKDFRLFTHKKRNMNIYAAAPNRTFDLTKQALRFKLNRNKIAFISGIDAELHELASMPHISSYLDQVSLTNRHLWKRLFKEDIRADIPELFHVSGESLASSLLFSYIKDPAHLFSRILFDQKMRNSVIKLFEGIDGCWHPDLDHGTHFFWAIDQNGKAQRLKLHGDALDSVDRSIHVPLTPESVLEHLKTRKIYPSLFLVYGILIFYCGIKPLVGGRSGTCLSAMKDRWQDIVEPEERALVESIQTDCMVQVGSFSMHALDVIYKGGFSLKDIKRLEARRLADIFVSKCI